MADMSEKVDGTAEIEVGCQPVEESFLPELPELGAPQRFLSSVSSPAFTGRAHTFTASNGSTQSLATWASSPRRAVSVPLIVPTRQGSFHEGSFFRDDDGGNDAGHDAIQGTIGFAAAAPDLIGDRPESKPFSLRGWLPQDEKSWMHLIIVAFFVIVDSAYSLVDAWALDGAENGTAQTMLVAQSACSLLVSLFLAGGLEGATGLRSALDPWEILRWFPISIGFATASYTLARSYTLGIGASLSQALGMLYMPLTALLSRRLFHRNYGWLEMHAVGLLTFCAAAFTGVINRDSGAAILNPKTRDEVLTLSIISSCLSAFSAVAAERLLKAKYHPTSDSSSFFVQKFRLEVGGFAASLVLILAVYGWDKPFAFGDWNTKLTCSLLIRIVQSWYGGLIAKHVSTVARAIAACVKLVVVYAVQTTITNGLDVNFGALDLALILSGSALLYVVGRSETRREARIITGISLTPVVGTEGSSFEAEKAQEDELPVDETESQEDGKTACMTCVKRMGELGIVLLFIMADAGRTMAFAWAINSAPIASQSVVFMRSASSVVIGVAVSTGIHDCTGFKQVFNFRRILLFFPISFCFSAGATLTTHAYACGMSATANTVLGYSYMPLSAMLSRWVFKRAYSGLEWLSLTIITLSAIAFMLTKDTSGEDSPPLSVEAVLSCFGSVFLSAIGAIFAEKLLKGQSQPFYIQNTHLELGGTVTAFLGMFVIGLASTRDKDAFWKPRLVNGSMESGWFVGWEPKTVWALLATICQSWLGGLVSKRLNTVVRAVAQCMSLLVIYFLGDVILGGEPLDWIRGCASIIVVLSVLIFAQASTKTKKQA